MSEESKIAAVETADSGAEIEKAENIKVEAAPAVVEAKKEKAPEQEDQKKSDLSEDDLVKSLEKIEALAKSETPDARKQALLEKAQQGDLPTEERDELFSLMSGGAAADSFGTEVAKSLTDDSEDIQKAIDISDYVSELHSGLVKALTAVGDRVEKSETHQHETNLVLAKGLLDMGKLAQQTQLLVKAVHEDVASLTQRPIRAPRSQLSGVQGIQKSIGGAPAAEDQISKSEVHSLLHDMLQKSMQEGRDGAAQCGVDITNAASLYEQGGKLGDELMHEVAAFRRGKMNGTA
jgi:hypothetical protein